jgi:integrase/recombinase XerD
MERKPSTGLKLDRLDRRPIPAGRDGPNDRSRGVTSHYARHLRTTWFKIEQNWPRDLVQYLGRDVKSGGKIRVTRDAIGSYIHTYYEDAEERYRGKIFKFRI